MKKLAPWLWLFLILAPLLRSATPALSSVSIATSRVQFETGDSITIREVFASSPAPVIGDVVLVRGDYTLQTRDRARISMFTTNGTSPTVNTEVSKGTGAFELQYTIALVGTLRLTWYNAAASGENFGGINFDVTGPGTGQTTITTPTTPATPTTTTGVAPAGMVPIAFTLSRTQFAAGDSITVREMFASSRGLQAGDTVLVRGDYTVGTDARVRITMFPAISGTFPAASKELTATSGTFELQYVLPLAAALRLSLYHAEPPGDVRGSVTLEGITVASVSVPADAKGSVANLSIRGMVTADAAMLAGLAVTDQDRFVLIRAVGPTLSAFGVSGVLRKPVISLHRAGELVQTIGAWSALPANQRTGIGMVTQSVGGFPLNAGSDDAVLHVRLAPGTYTLTISSGDGQPGTTLLEVYSAGNYFLPASP